MPATSTRCALDGTGNRRTTSPRWAGSRAGSRLRSAVVSRHGSAAVPSQVVVGCGGRPGWRRGPAGVSGRPTAAESAIAGPTGRTARHGVGWRSVRSTLTRRPVVGSSRIMKVAPPGLSGGQTPDRPIGAIRHKFVVKATFTLWAGRSAGRGARRRSPVDVQCSPHSGPTRERSASEGGARLGPLRMPQSPRRPY